MKQLTGIDVTNKSRERNIVTARNMVMYQMRLDGMRLADIGKAFGLDHSTVIHSCNSIVDMLHYPTTKEKEVTLWKRFNDRLINDTIQ